MNNFILSLVTWLPAVGAILILALMKKDQSSLIKKFATGWFALDFILSLWLLKYDRVAGGMQFLEDYQWIPIIGARYQMGVDGVAVLLIVLTTLLGGVMNVNNPGLSPGGVPLRTIGVMSFVLTFVTILAAFGDLRVSARATPRR